MVRLCSSSFETIPDELCESARLTAPTTLSLFTYYSAVIYFSIAALIIFMFVSNWNQYEAALVYLRSKELATIPLGLSYFQEENSTSYGAIMAASVCSLIPIFAVFLAFQKQFVQGIVTTGLKE